jgi:hypothetical protein
MGLGPRARNPVQSAFMFYVANEMDAEDGLIWVYGVGEDGVMAFTDFGIETLMELIRIYKESPKLLSR